MRLLPMKTRKEEQATLPAINQRRNFDIEKRVEKRKNTYKLKFGRLTSVQRRIDVENSTIVLKISLKKQLCPLGICSCLTNI